VDGVAGVIAKICIVSIPWPCFPTPKFDEPYSAKRAGRNGGSAAPLPIKQGDRVWQITSAEF
jgi:hypothetical protein